MSPGNQEHVSAGPTVFYTLATLLNDAQNIDERLFLHKRMSKDLPKPQLVGAVEFFTPVRPIKPPPGPRQKWLDNARTSVDGPILRKAPVSYCKIYWRGLSARAPRVTPAIAFLRR